MARLGETTTDILSGTCIPVEIRSGGMGPPSEGGDLSCLAANQQRAKDRDVSPICAHSTSPEPPMQPMSCLVLPDRLGLGGGVWLNELAQNQMRRYATDDWPSVARRTPNKRRICKQCAVD